MLYGERGLVAFEVKRTDRVREEDLAGLRAFREDYPVARTYFVHLGARRAHAGGIEVVPMTYALKHLEELLRGESGSKKPRRKRPSR